MQHHNAACWDLRMKNGDTSVSACSPNRASACVRLSSHSVSSVASKNGGNGGSVCRRFGRGFAARLESGPARAGICCGSIRRSDGCLASSNSINRAAWGCLP